MSLLPYQIVIPCGLLMILTTCMELMKPQLRYKEKSED